MPTAGPRRLLDVFPPGFDSKSTSSRGHYHFATEQLYHRLTNEYQPEYHIGSTLVRSLWYGKQTKSAQHELILIEVEDTLADLKNYMVVDRNLDETVDSTGQRKSEMPSCADTRRNVGNSSRSCRGAALDAFRVSYDGVEKKLLAECHLLPREYLEKIEFGPEDPLYLYQFVTLVQIVSEQSPNYAMAYRNCYWFAGLIWECMRFLHPAALYDGRLSNKRGKFSILRYTPEEREKEEICKAFENEIQKVEQKLAHSRKIWGAVNLILNKHIESQESDAFKDSEQDQSDYRLRTIGEISSYPGSRNSIAVGVPNRCSSLDLAISKEPLGDVVKKERIPWYKWRAGGFSP